MLRPPHPAPTSSICFWRSGRSLTAFALGVSGAAPLPTFLIAFGASAGASKTENLHTISPRKELSFFLSLRSAREREKLLVRWDNREVAFTGPLHRMFPTHFIVPKP